MGSHHLTGNMLGQAFISWIMSVLALQDTRQEMVTNNQVDSLGNIIMANKFNMQDQEENNIKRPFTTLVEGNVGSGKSTFLNTLDSLPDIQVFPEPVESWQQVGRKNLLEDMYADYDSIVSVLESQDTRQEMVTNTQLDSLGNIIMANRVYTQDQEKNNFKRPFTILVEGNVGSGKSTFLNTLDSLPDIQVFPEPVESWQQVGRQNLLEDMYAEPHRWTTTFQLYTSLTGSSLYLKSQESSSPVVMLERSLYSERYCFVEMLLHSGVITKGEAALLDRWFITMTNTTLTGMEVDLIVYIRSDPDILINRIDRRGRQEEDGLPFSFLQDLHTMHEDWLVRGKYPIPAPVVVLDGNLDLGQFTAMVNKWAETLQSLHGISG